MLTNRQIKRKELFKAQQKLIKVLGDLKQAQNNMLVALNDCFASEYYNENSLKKGIKSLAMKNAVKHYASVYKDKLSLEELITSLKQWQPVLESEDINE